MKRLLTLGAVSLIATHIAPARSPAQTVPYAVSACQTNAYCTATVVVIGGITYWAITRNGNTTYYEYLEEPDDESPEDYWSDYIWADTNAEAWARCRDYAQRMGTELIDVQQRGRGNRYECLFRRIRV